jgi:hypothetical protein
MELEGLWWEKGEERMRSDKRLSLQIIGVLFPFIFLVSFSIPMIVFAQEIKEEKKEAPDKLSYLIENGARMISGNEFAKVLSGIESLPPEKRADFRIRVLENFASLKAYLVTKKKEYGKKWQSDYKQMCYTGNKTATPLLVELLNDSDPYMRAFTARALGYLGDQTALEAVKRVADSDQNSKVRSRAMWAYEHISGSKFPKETPKED